MQRALVLAVVLLGMLASPAAAESPGPRIVNGNPADEGEYPSQGFLLVDVGGGFFAGCGGTVVSPRRFVTAGHCVADDARRPRPPAAFDVFLGENLQSNFGSAERPVVTAVALHPDYAEDADEHTNDVAVLSFAGPVSVAPRRIIRPGETALWAPGDTATIIGWGDTFDGQDTGTNELREATAPIRDDLACFRYGQSFIAATMVCVGNGSADTCQGDSGGPLLVSDGVALVLAGVVSWGIGCNDPDFPGLYARIGEPRLNAWVRGRVRGADFAIATPAPRAGEPVAFTATAPAGAQFSWDFDDDGAFDATGSSASHVFATAGEYETVLRVTDLEGEPAEQRRELVVAPAVATPAPTPVPVVPPVATPRAPKLATILASGRPQVRRGRFKLRINFAATAPAGIAVIEVFRGKRKIGSGRGRVRRGGSRQVSIKLTKTGRRLLRRSESKRLRVRVQVRVKRRVLRSRGLTIRL